MTSTGRPQRKSKCSVCGTGKCAFVSAGMSATAVPRTKAKIVKALTEAMTGSGHGKKHRKGKAVGAGLFDLLPAGMFRDGANFLKGAL